MNAARDNARRLVEDARLLFEAGRYPTACSLAILSIEESGKCSVLRGLAIAPNDKQLAKAWRQYRSHQHKNAAWIIMELAAKGARTLDELSEVFSPNSDHTVVLDTLKQIGFYTDNYAGAKAGEFWSEPHKVIEPDLAKSIIQVAEVFARNTTRHSEREIELWVQHVGPHWGTLQMKLASIDFHEALVSEGLTDTSVQEMQEFLGLAAPKTPSH